MQNLNLEHNIPMPVFDRNYWVVNRATSRQDKSIILAKISERDEHQLDAGKTVKLVIENLDFSVDPRNVICYGKIDISDFNSKDFEQIDRIAMLDEPVHLPLNYDYDTHSCISDKPFYKTCESLSAGEYIQYICGCLGKPQRIVIFRQGYVCRRD